MSIDPRNDRICYYERIMNAFLCPEGYCNIRGAAEKIVELEEKAVKTDQPDDCLSAFEAYWGKRGWDLSRVNNPSGYVELKDERVQCLWMGCNSRPTVRESGTENALRAELAAYRAVFEASVALTRTMDDVDNDEAGQSDRVFASFEFDQLRYAIEQVENLTAAATAETEGQQK